MAKRKKRDKKIQKIIVNKRINKLFSMAEQRALSGNLILADRYVKIARKLAMRNLVQITREHKRRFCKHCYCYLLPHVTCRIRIHKGKLVVYCYNCEKYIRFPLKNSRV
jgi:ribonuclease P protein subunit RPR2